RVIVEGEPRPLHPLLRDDIYRIGREALVNAFRHSRAKNIEIELEYGSRFRVLIRDNGSGIDDSGLRSGREGHGVLRGMREGAEKMGGRFSVRSAPAAGTEVELSVPGSVAFLAQDSNGLRGRLSRLYRRNASGKQGSKSSEDGNE